MDYSRAAQPPRAPVRSRDHEPRSSVVGSHVVVHASDSRRAALRCHRVVFGAAGDAFRGGHGRPATRRPPCLAATARPRNAAARTPAVDRARWAAHAPPVRGPGAGLPGVPEGAPPDLRDLPEGRPHPRHAPGQRPRRRVHRVRRGAGLSPRTAGEDRDIPGTGARRHHLSARRGVDPRPPEQLRRPAQVRRVPPGSVPGVEAIAARLERPLPR